MARKREEEEKYKMDSVKFVILTQEKKKGAFYQKEIVLKEEMYYGKWQNRQEMNGGGIKIRSVSQREE